MTLHSDLLQDRNAEIENLNEMVAILESRDNECDQNATESLLLVKLVISFSF